MTVAGRTPNQLELTSPGLLPESDPRAVLVDLLKHLHLHLHPQADSEGWYRWEQRRPSSRDEGVVVGTWRGGSCAGVDGRR